MNELLGNPRISVVLFKQAAPVLLGLSGTTLYLLADSMFVSRLGSAPLAALGYTIPPVLLVVNIMFGLGMGATASVAPKLGARDLEGARTLATRSVWLGLAVAMTLGPLVFMLRWEIVRALGAQDSIAAQSVSFLTVWLWGAPFQALMQIGTAALRAAGDSKTSAIVLLTAAVLNIALDPILIFGWLGFPAMGLVGAAFATLIGNGAAAVLAMSRMLASGLLDLSDRGHGLLTSWKEIGRVAGPSSVTYVSVPFGAAVLTGIIAGHGPGAVAAYGVAGRIDNLVRLVPLALAGALAPFVGQNWGASQIERARLGVAIARRGALLWGLVSWAILAASATTIAGFFSDDPSVTGALAAFLWFASASLGWIGTTTVSSAALNAVRKPLEAAAISILRAFVLPIPLALLGDRVLGLPGLFAGVALAAIISDRFAIHWLAKASLRRAMDVGGPVLFRR